MKIAGLEYRLPSEIGFDQQILEQRESRQKTKDLYKQINNVLGDTNTTIEVYTEGGSYAHTK